jgi:diacylglycerol O-acyltransferase / wax synthase
VVTVRRLSALDASFLALETDGAPLHVGALLVLDGPAPDADLLRAELSRRASAVEECRQRVHARANGLRRPIWVDDPGFAPDWHLHVAPAQAPGDRAALRGRVVELMDQRLHMSRPPWEVWRVEGLADGAWALLVKAHHSLIDGASGAGLLTALLSPMDAQSARPAPRVGPRARPALHERVRRLRQGLRAVAVPDLPSNALNGPLGGGRTWDWLTVDMADLRLVAGRAGCTINDVYLAALTGGLRATLDGRASLDSATRVRALVPVSTRRGLGDVRTGNIDAAFFVELPVHLGSAHQMLDDVARQTSRAKADGLALATEELLGVGVLVPAPLLDGAARAYVRRGQARVNFVASDVRGPSAPLWLCGRPVRDIVPCVPLALNVRATSALLSYAGRASISVTLDRVVVPDAEVLVRAVAATLAELV